MKRFLSLVLVLLLFFTLTAPVSASQLLPQIGSLLSKAGTTYTDADSGKVLTIPGGWSVTEIKGDPVAKAEFTCTEDGSAVVEYGSVDLWALLEEAEQKALPREAFDNSQYTLKDIAELVDTKEKYVKKVQIGAAEYYRAEVRSFFFKVTATYLIRIDQGWMYAYAFSGGDSHDCYGDFEAIVASASPAEEAAELPEETSAETIEETTVPAEPSEGDIYAQAVKEYNCGKYDAAEDLFASVPNYEDSEKYQRLIRIRSYGTNFGIGTVYDPACGLTQAQKADIDAAMEDFYFADTNYVLLHHTDVACYVLFGEWITASGTYPYAYFKMKADSVGGYYYTRSTNLSKATSDTVSINNGIVHISITGPNTLVFQIELTAPDCMKIYSFETGNSFTLYKQ